MSEYFFSFVDVKTLADARSAIQDIGSDSQSIDIMAPKAVSRVIRCQNVRLQDAIIIKQDMLSLGGEVALPKEAFSLKDEAADILIIGTIKQLTELAAKLSRHYPRLQRFSTELSIIIKKI